MKINIRPIQQSVVDFTDRTMILARKLMEELKDDSITDDKASEIILRFCEDNAISMVGLMDGIAQINYRALYLGSKGVQENLTNLLNAPDEEIKGILAQWLAAETSMWEVVPDEECDE